MAYTKLFSSIVHSTIWREADHVRLVWVTMLALASKRGVVSASVPGLADVSRVTLEQCQEALEKLSSPDPYSRSKVEEGRRIREIDGGWELINHRYYREIKDEEQERIDAAERQRRHRDKKKREVTESNAESRSSQMSRPVTPPTPSPSATPTPENETDTSPSAPVPSRVSALWSLYKQHLGCSDRMRLDSKRRKKLEARIAEGRTDEEFRLAFTGCATSTFHRENHHTDLELICRDASHFDRFVEMGRSVGRPRLSREMQETRDGLRNFLQRHGGNADDLFGGFGQGASSDGGGVREAGGGGEGGSIPIDPLPTDE